MVYLVRNVKKANMHVHDSSVERPVGCRQDGHQWL